MLISTSRKPSQRTRTFCQSLSRALNFPYVNRGKMSLRDLSLKALDLEENYILLVYEAHANPNEMVFLNGVEELLRLKISISINTTRLNIDPFELSIVSDFKELDKISEYFGFKLLNDDDSDYIYIKKKNNEAIMDFIDSNGESTGLKVFIKDYKFS